MSKATCCFDGTGCKVTCMGSETSCSVTGVREMGLSANSAGILITVISSVQTEKAERLRVGSQHGNLVDLVI